MALIRKNKEYVKIDLDNFQIENNQIIVSITCYKDANSRNYEKLYGQQIKSFINNTTKHIEQLNNNLEDYVKQLCPKAKKQADYAQYESVLNNDSKLKEMAQFLNSLYDEFNKICNILKGNIPNKGNFTNLEIFKELGLNTEWLDNPIIIIRTMEINVGEIKDEPLNGENIYPLLKNKMPNTKDDI